MKKMFIMLLVFCLVFSASFSAFAVSIPFNSLSDTTDKNTFLPLNHNTLMDSNELFQMMYNEVSSKLTEKRMIKGVASLGLAFDSNLDSLEKEKYSKLSKAEALEHLSEESKMVLAKIMAYRYSEAVRVSNSVNLKSRNFVADTPKIPASLNNSTNIRVAAYYVQNKPVAIKLHEDFLVVLRFEGLISATIFRDLTFKSYVKAGGPWDLKRFLGTHNEFEFLHATKTGEYIGNYHYGYMGKHAGYALWYLRAGAGFYQVYRRTSDWRFIKSYFDDPRDQEAIIKGYADFNIDFGKGLFY
ncbi:MAG: polymorphic toxin type 44 domain-containing protein [Alkaliphilus sp.]